MKGLNFLLILLLVFVMATSVIFSCKLFDIEQKVDALAKRQSWSTVNEIKKQVGILRYETKKVYENTRPKTFDELIEEAMSEENG